MSQPDQYPTSGKSAIKKPVQYVRQEEIYGCAIACLAMITGQTYWEVKKDMNYWPDVGGKEGMSVDFVGASYLFEKFGYVAQTKYPTVGYTQAKRENWIKPFAEIHIVSVQTTGAHAVVMDAEGNIKDPNLGDIPRKLTDYDVKSITGFWKVM